ncbi:hypothetical protein Hanom_Chr11g01055421 [Helianthus anomalus]
MFYLNLLKTVFVIFYNFINKSEIHGWSLWFTKILDLVPSFLKVHRWSLWFALCNALSP